MHCKNCCNLIPYGNQRLYDFIVSTQALKLLTKTCHIASLQIQGGEPLTHPEIAKFVDAIAQLPIKELSITTNGTIPLSQELLLTLKKYNHIHVKVSNYDTKPEVRAKVLQQLQENNIPHSLYNFLYGDKTWFNSGDFEEARNDNDAQVASYYATCAQKGVSY